MRFPIIIILGIGALSAQVKIPDTPDTPEATPAVKEPSPEIKAPSQDDPALLFAKGKSLGNVGDNPKNAYRRLVQRTIMPTEPTPRYGAVLTFDDQLIPQSEGDSSALEVARDLREHHARAIFFANMPDNSSKVLSAILRAKKPEEATRTALLKRKPAFMKTVRELLKMKDGDQFVCEVYNHTAFHQNMKSMKVGSKQFKVCMTGIRFIEECLDEAYASERPDMTRTPYFRFPFLHEPTSAATRKALDGVFTELGLISLGETQDSKDVLNFSADLAYQSLAAAQKNQRFSPNLKAYGETEQPIALFHTRSWSRIKSGIIKAIRQPEATPER